jgi:hypothetical protein
MRHQWVTSGAQPTNICANCQSHGSCPLPNSFVSDVSPMNITGYIRRFHVTDKYIVIFIGTDEQVDLNLSELCSSVNSSVNQWIYSNFLGLEDKFIGFNGRMNPDLL